MQDVVRNYNNTVHSSINMAPNQVNRSNASQLFDYLEGKRNKISRKRKSKFGVGDLVRVALNADKKMIFKKAGTPNWSEKLYQIDRVEFGTHVPTYFLTDQAGAPISRRYYEFEILLVSQLSDLV